MGPPIRDGININPTAHFVEPGPTNTERYSQVSEGVVGKKNRRHLIRLLVSTIEIIACVYVYPIPNHPNN